jgi:hypothetical protein
MMTFRLFQTILLATVFFLAAGHPRAQAQQCPEVNPAGPSKSSAAFITKGVIIYHDALRQWYGLRLDKPVCGLTELQLTGANDQLWKQLELLRGCKATVSGTLNLPGTNYYSAEIFQEAQTIRPDPDCVQQPPFPDLSKARPPASIWKYKVSLTVSMQDEGYVHPEISHAGKPLTPWQAYTTYMLTGLYVFYGQCAKGFSMDHVSGTPEAKPWQMEEQAIMDPPSANEKKIDPVVMNFTCTRPLPPKKNAAPK